MENNEMTTVENTTAESGETKTENLSPTDENEIWTVEEISTENGVRTERIIFKIPMTEQELAKIPQGYAPIEYVEQETGIDKELLCSLYEKQEVDSLTTEDGHLWLSVVDVKEWQRNESLKTDTAAKTESDITESDEQEDEYLPLTKAAKQMKIDYHKLAYQFDKGEIKGYRKGNKRIMLNMDSMKKWKVENIHPLAFGDLRLDFDTYWKPILSKNYADEIFYPKRYEFKGQYWLSNTGQVWSAESGRILKTATSKRGYEFVKLVTVDGKSINCYIHRMVAYYFCKGYLRCGTNTVHHIDGDRKNNDYKNLIWVTTKEHRELHRLMPNKREYRKKLTAIRKENASWYKHIK